MERFELVNRVVAGTGPLRPRRTARPALNLASNELHHPALPGLLTQLLASVSERDACRYPAYAETLDGLSAYFERPADEILLLPGSDAGIRVLCSALALSGQKVRILLQAPNYEAWTNNSFAPGLEIRPVDSSSGDAAGSFEALLSELGRQPPAQVVALSWPNGPAGYTPPAEQLDVLERRVHASGALLVIDGAYCAFSTHPRRLAERAGGQTLVLVSFSKSHGLAGARVAALLADPATIGYLRRWTSEEHVSGLSQVLLRAALVRDNEFVAMWADVRANREWFFNELEGRGLRPIPSGGNFVNFRLPGGVDIPSFVRRVEQRGLLIRNTSAHAGLGGCARSTVSGDTGTMLSLVDAIDEAGAARRWRPADQPVA